MFLTPSSKTFFSQLITSILISTLLFISLIVTKIFTDPFVTGKIFYFIFSLSTILTWLLVKNINSNKTKKVAYNYADIFAVLLLLYGLLRALTTPYFSFTQHPSTLFFGSVLVYFVVRYTVSNQIVQFGIKSLLFKVVVISIMLTTTVQIIAGYLQLAGVINSNNTNFSVTGFFNNPGPYAIFIAVMLPFLIGLVLYNNGNLLLRIFAGIVSIAIMVMLPFTESRAGWIAALSGITFLFLVKYKFLSVVNIFLKSTIKKVIALALITLLLAASGFYLFQYKKDSALGRKFIWQTTLTAISDKPLTGYGIGQYEKTHNTYQANYFRNNPHDKINAMLAADDPYALNDYLQLTTDLGIIGLLLFAVFFIALFKQKTDIENNYIQIIAKSLVIAILTASLFSYPLQKIPIAVLLFFFAGLISGMQQNKVLNISLSPSAIKSFSGIALLLTVMVFKFETNRFKAYKQWKQAYVLTNANPDKALKIYNKLYPKLHHDKLFMFNYGAELSAFGQNNKSIKILEQTLNLYNSAKVLVYLGDNYEATEQYDKAIKSFEQASYLIPHRFYPKFRLVPLYYGIGREEMALQLAKEIMAMEVKVPSETVNSIKRETQSFLNIYN